MQSEYHISEEFRQQKAEGKRRQRIHEGIDMATMKEKGGCIGTAKLAGAGLPMAEAVVIAAADSENFAIWPMDTRELAMELRDLDRDIEGFVKSEGVRFE